MFRVVFDASCKSDSGLSINDVQYPAAIVYLTFSAHFRMYSAMSDAIVGQQYLDLKSIWSRDIQWVIDVYLRGRLSLSCG